MATYSLNGIPSDLLNSPVEGARRLKVEAVVVDASQTPESGLIKKEFWYNQDGSVDYLIETNLTTLIQIKKQFVYNQDGTIQSVTPSIL